MNEPGPVAYSQGYTGEEGPGANQGQNDAVSLHQQSKGTFGLRRTDWGLSLIFSELAPLKLYNYRQAGDNSQRPISDQPSLFFQGCKLQPGHVISMGGGQDPGAHEDEHLHLPLGPSSPEPRARSCVSNSEAPSRMAAQPSLVPESSSAFLSLFLVASP